MFGGVVQIESWNAVKGGFELTMAGISVGLRLERKNMCNLCVEICYYRAEGALLVIGVSP